ncbi:MAG: LAGLIDADG family homing endonuclease [Nanoarchaeota archaeon]
MNGTLLVQDVGQMYELKIPMNKLFYHYACRHCGNKRRRTFNFKSELLKVSQRDNFCSMSCATTFRNLKNSPWNESKINYLKDNYGKQQAVKIAKNIDMPIIGVYQQAHKLKLSGFNKKGFVGFQKPWNKIPIKNENFFASIDSETKAYWLGFIAADGNVYNNRLTLVCASKDKEHLIRFQNAVGTKRNLRFETHRYSKQYSESSSYRLRIGSTQLVQDLIRNNIVPKKSLILKFPKLRENLMRHFIRGYFDGDGCITYPKKEKRNGRFIITSGSQEFLYTLQPFFLQHGFFKTKIRKQKNKNVYHLSYGGRNNIRKIYVILYKNATVYLPRKKRIFEEILC